MRTAADPIRAHSKIAEALLLAAAFVLAYVGYRAFWFLTDDAFITFRYVSNAMLGRGLVWNPPPFVPVEGYTSFLWTILLLGIWKVTGVEPPDCANALSFLCALGTLTIVARATMRMRLPKEMEGARLGLTALVLLGTLTNRTSLAWMSSGLETALFNLIVTAWFFALSSYEQRSFTSLFALTTLLAWTRPDGLLFCAITVGWFMVRQVMGSPSQRPSWGALWPLVGVFAHLAFRVWKYGELVPNTYFAKHVAPWPESGLRYLAAFALEYALWFWFLLLVVQAITALRAAKNAPHAAPRRERVRRWVETHGGLCVGVLGLFGHAAYYTLIVGGDHFEFRIYSHLVPLIFMSALSAAAFTLKSPRNTIAALSAFIALSWPIPWTHWLKTKDLTLREQTKVMIVPIAASVPWPIRPVARVWDELEDWLIKHYVGMRHQEHKILAEGLLLLCPPRKVGARIPYTPRPVLVTNAVGIASYSLPNVAIIDRHGLNDRVVARNPVPNTKDRKMAHDRSAPPGYAECFRPNVELKRGKIIRTFRTLTDDEIRACERRYGAY